MLFSERYGYTKPREALQIESMDEPLKNRLWSVFHQEIVNRATQQSFNTYTLSLWTKFFKRPSDSILIKSPGVFYENSHIIKDIRAWYKECKWFDVYNFIEFTIHNIPLNNYSRLFDEINSVLQSEKSGYRLVNGQITPITNESEIQGIEDAINSTENNILKSVNTHLKAALTKLSDRKNPDFRNSIKESISAVEALVNIINGDTKGTLGTSIKKLKTKITIHPALESGFNSIYGYTSDAGGIRHAMMDDTNCDFDDAKYMLVSCSAFVNYLIGKASKAGLLSV